MFPTKEKDLESLLRIHKVPPGPRATPLLHPETTSETGLNLLNDTVALAREVAEALEEVPYVKSVTGIVLKIIKIREELKANRERCEEIIKITCQHSYKLFQSLDLVAKSSEGRHLASLNADLEEYKQLLESVLEGLVPFTDDTFAAKWKRIISRAKDASDLTKIERLLANFQQGFNISRLTAIEVKVTELAPRIGSSYLQNAFVRQALPPSPQLMVGRDTMIDGIVNALTCSDHYHVAILGQGGIGKTTLASRILRHPAIKQSYPTQFFVSCESSITTEQLLISLADALAIPEEVRKTNLESFVIRRLESLPPKSLLCLDNLETTWEDPVHRASVDSLLGKLSGLDDGLTLVITMRGTQSPATSLISWLEVILEGLDFACSVKMYESITREAADKDALALLKILDGLPLAINLFARLVIEGDKPIDLLSQWETRGTAMLENGGIDKLSTLNYSIQLSIQSPRMDDSARRILGLLACLPAGLKDTPETIDWSQRCLPDHNLHCGLRILRRVGLVYQQTEVSFDHRRWRMLSPIKEYCQRYHRPSEGELHDMITLWSSLLLSHRVFSNYTSRSLIEPDLPNFRNLLFQACNLRFVPIQIADAIVAYVEWAGWIGIYDVELCEKAVQITQDSRRTAELYHRMGVQAFAFSHVNNAELSFRRALHLFIEINDQLGQANSFKSLGVIQKRRAQLQDAEESLRRALDLYVELDNQHGQANTLKSIGWLHLRSDRLDYAEKSFVRALHLWVKIDNRQGQATALRSITHLHTRRDQLDEAEKSVRTAQDICTEIGDRYGQASSLRSLGAIQMRRGQLDGAEETFRKSLELMTEMGTTRGQGTSHLCIASLLLQRGKGHEAAAEEEAATALDQHRAAQDQWGEIDNLVILGRIQVKLGKLELGEESLTQGLAIAQRIKLTAIEGQGHHGLGELALVRGEHEKAIKEFNTAIEIHRDRQHPYEMRLDIRALVDALRADGNLKDAERWETQLRSSKTDTKTQ